MIRVFKTRTFTRSMKKAGLTDAALCAAVEEMGQGLVDADLGGNVVKKRVALPGQGKRVGARTIVATRMAGRWFCLFEEVTKELPGFDDRQLTIALAAGEIVEICDSDDKA